MKIVAKRGENVFSRSGAYIGSIGAGGFEVRPDGKFYRCRIFNNWKPEIDLNAYFMYEDENGQKALQLFDIIRPDRVVEGVKSLTYEFQFPRLKLYSEELPVEVELLSFFIPRDIKNSSLPSILIRVRGKGKGNFFFVFQAPFSGENKAEDNKAIVKSNLGELELSCSNGRVFTFRVDNYETVAIKWDGTFEDEVILSWYFPGMKDFEGNTIGHYYENFFSSCSEVTEYIKKNKEKLVEKTMEFSNSIYSNNLPDFIKDAYAAQLSSFLKESWFTKDGKFGVWEGSPCCCGLQTTDVAFYGSWLYVNLFPELEKSGIKLTSSFQREDGWIPHFFPGTFNRIDEYRRKDMNMQFVLMVARDYFLWKDKEFLREMYPKVRKAIEIAYSWDTDGDKIPDIEGPDQTFDVWNWKGCSIYLSSLWMAALYFGGKLAEEYGDKEFSKKCFEDLNVVKENTIKKLWNGEYFILWNNGKTKDEGCLLDALAGEWYCTLLGMENILPKEMIKSHLRACLKYNKKKIDPSYMKAYYTPGEEGWCYINGGYKDDKKYCFQQYEPWTGIEYAFAIHLYLQDMKEEAFQVVRDVVERKLKCGMFFNHIECGGDYFRPLVIGAFWELLNGKYPPKI